MDDGTGHAAGGRLVMLGTPNRGSFAPALALTGVEKLVRRLALIDGDHRLPALLAILATFGGLYQMLPSPLVDLGDDHDGLFAADTWPTLVHQALLDAARTFQVDLHDVIDPDRLVYVAGADRDTPARVRVDRRAFRYEFTRDGDGRVPHTLGLLDGVTTYYVDEDHGDLPKNGSVLDAIHDLLATGRSSALASAPERRSVDELSVSRRARSAGDEAGDAGVAALAALGRGSDGQALTDRERIRLATLITEDYLGRGGGTPTALGVPAEVTVPPIVEIDVVWGDVTKVVADLYSVGHYRGVVPQRAEGALDDAITRAGAAARRDEAAAEGIIAKQTRRNGIRADVGDISFFPWSDPKRPRVVAVAGMGSPGTFDAAALRRLVKSAAIAASDLPTVATWCSVLIGSGEGTLTTQEAVAAWVRGLADAAVGLQALHRRAVPKLVIAEMVKGRAERIADCFRNEATELAEAGGAIVLRTSRRPLARAGRRLGDDDANQLLLSALAHAAKDDAPPALRQAWHAIERELDIADFLRDEVADYVARSANGHDDDTTSSSIPSRISFLDGDGVLRVAAIDETATVPERLVPIDPSLLTELVVRMTDASVEQAHALGATLYRFAVPGDFRPMLSAGGPFVLELDRTTAGQHWEMCRADDDDHAEPLAVRAQVARQLRTTYSPASARRTGASSQLRALVIGDPGDPATGHGLPGARDEALAVRAVLLDHDVVVDARIGAPSVPRTGKLAGIEAANRLDVLDLLVRGGYDIVHYAGHGDFDAARPDRVGWVFASGLLTSNEIQSLERAPTLIVANACLSARLSTVGADRRPMKELERRAHLAPGLADEFLKLGVRDYVGTAWEVNDIGATNFAKRFYRELLGDRMTLGHAINAARRELWSSRRTFGSLWAAYQHYGDPNAVLRPGT